MLERRTRSVSLTEAGTLLQSLAQQVLALIEDTKTEIMDDGRSDRIRIGAIATIAPYFLPNLLREFSDEFPAAMLVVQEETTGNLLKRCTHYDRLSGEGLVLAAESIRRTSRGGFNMADKPTLTTTAGAPIADNQNAQTAGPRGPVLFQDYQLLEKLAHQNRERIAERVVHAKGWGRHGTLKVEHDISQYTKAKCLQPGVQTELLARFSTVAGESGAADAERDVRGFALKFYTEEGNWDMVGNNTPVFFVRDPYKFPDFIHTQKRHPKTNLRSPTAMWDFWSLSPESLHQVTILFSDRGLPIGVRHMNGYGSHTFSFINAQNERFWVKFHFKTVQGHQHWTNEEAEQVIAKSRESYSGGLVLCRSSEGSFRSGNSRCRSCRKPMPKRRRTTRSISPRSGRTTIIL